MHDVAETIFANVIAECFEEGAVNEKLNDEPIANFMLKNLDASGKQNK